MKIAFLLPGGLDRSGTHRVFPWFQAMVERFVNAGDEVHVFILYHEPKPGRWQVFGATVHNAGARRWGLRTLRSLWSEHRRAPFDVIHAFWTNPGVVGAVAAVLLNIPFAMTLADDEVANIPEIGFGDQRHWRRRLYVRMIIACAGIVTAPSRLTTEHAHELGIAARTVPMGVDLLRWPVRAPQPRDPGALLRLLHVGGLRPAKDTMTLLEALAILRAEGLGFEIDVIGAGSLKGTIQQAAADRGLGPAIRFSNHEFMPQTELRPYFERADLLVMSSIYEAGPVVALEAGVAGVPTVGTRVGHIADMAPAAAIAVPVRDFVALAAGIRELAHDEPKRHRLALEAQGYAIKRDADYTAATFKAIYLELAAGSKRRARRTAQAHEVIGQ